MARTLPEEYKPTTPPIEFPNWHRWIDEELNRIALALTASPTIFSIENSGLPIGIDTVPTTVVIGIDDTPQIDFPGGAWDSVTGEYTVAQSGIYSIDCRVFIESFGPGNKTYIATLEIFRNNILLALAATGGADDVPLAAGINRSEILEVGDVMRVDLTTLHEQFTGATTYGYSLSYLRNASV